MEPVSTFGGGERSEEERRQLEAQVRVSQKMEAIGRLAGGVAHDFNNLPSVILSYAEFAINRLRDDDPLRNDLLEVKKAGERAAVLTHQLLAFGSKHLLQPVPIDVNRIAEDVESMLRRILGEDIEFVQVLAPNLGVVKADPGQIEQVLVNLVVNAREAMPEGGTLTIETSNVEFGEEYAACRAEVSPGSYVQIAVTDTGCGMDGQLKERIFEPFFTTKGKGTGLGLSTVYGIVKRSGGRIWVYSEPGHGTTFKIYLPREPSLKATSRRLRAIAAPGSGDETILLVEDEKAIREVAKRALETAGYKVLSAAAADQAMQTAAQHKGEIHLLLTDVVMPRMSGRALAHEISKARPGIKIVYMSGYADNAFVNQGVVEEGTHFISKPFAGSDLTRKVRDVLDSELAETHDERRSAVDLLGG